jgi:hypothetical protein
MAGRAAKGRNSKEIELAPRLLADDGLDQTARASPQAEALS